MKQEIDFSLSLFNQSINKRHYRQRRKKYYQQFGEEKLKYTHTHTQGQTFAERTHIDLLLSYFLTGQLFVVSPKRGSDKDWLIYGHSFPKESWEDQQVYVSVQICPNILKNLEWHTPKVLTYSSLWNEIPCHFKCILFAYFYF